MSASTYMILILATLGIQFWRSKAAEAEVAGELERVGLRGITAMLRFWKGGRNSFYIEFHAMDREGKRVSGHAIKYPFRAVQMNYDGVDLSLPREGDALSPAQLRRLAETAGQPLSLDVEASLEDRIRFETNQRLERLQGDREAFLANDTDGDGVVDAEEWELVRERVAAEVSAELTGSATPPPHSPVEEDPAIEADVVAEPEVAEADGHW